MCVQGSPNTRHRSMEPDCCPKEKCCASIHERLDHEDDSCRNSGLAVFGIADHLVLAADNKSIDQYSQCHKPSKEW
ncbi:hypothetical protein SDC9_103331 [bioreactor metagenome]|uniref:Uncharacterized protein n=1 Tax=bioreactor metagenome TaxID=1076179 RepID=A0A645ATC5_9ZZZZ